VRSRARNEEGSLYVPALMTAMTEGRTAHGGASSWSRIRYRLHARSPLGAESGLQTCPYEVAKQPCPSCVPPGGMPKQGKMSIRMRICGEDNKNMGARRLKRASVQHATRTLLIHARYTVPPSFIASREQQR
jgi:hypothetical protein